MGGGREGVRLLFVIWVSPPNRRMPSSSRIRKRMLELLNGPRGGYFAAQQKGLFRGMGRRRGRKGGGELVTKSCCIVL